MHTLVKAFRRPTIANYLFCEGPLMLVPLSMAMPVLFFTQIGPVLMDSGLESKFVTSAWLVGISSICMLVVALLRAFTIWARIVDDQAINDEAGYNKVGMQEDRDMRRYDAAYDYLKRRKRRQSAND